MDLLAALAGVSGVDAAPDSLAAAVIDGRAPRAVVTPATREEIARVVTLAEEAGAAIIPRGSGMHSHIGRVPERYDLALSSLGLQRVVAHDAADMTATVEAGVTLQQLDDVLRPTGQWLPLDPPRPEAVTVGGLLAADLNGGLRFSHGKVRDYLIGARAVIGGGVLVRGGGNVVKNVAGYDMPKLLVGSYGSLGVIVEATFKVRPRPSADITLASAYESLAAAGEHALGLFDAPLAPFALDVCNAAAAAALGLPQRPYVLLRLGGEEAEVRDQRDRVSHLLAAPAEVDEAVRGPARDFSLGGAIGARLALLPTELLAQLDAVEREATVFGVAIKLLAHAGSGVAHVALEHERGALPFLRWLRFLAHQRHGHLIIERLPVALKGEIDVWGETTAPLDLMRRVKAALDPRRTFSPGRFVGGI